MQLTELPIFSRINPLLVCLRIQIISIRTESCIRLYLDLGSLGGAQCHLVGEDDISLSSIEDNDHDDDDRKKDCDKDGNEHDEGNAPIQKVADANNNTETDDVVDLTDSPSAPLRERTEPLRATGINNFNNDEIDLTRITNATENFEIDRWQTAHHKQSPFGSDSQSIHPSRQTSINNINSNSNDPEDQNKIQRLTRIAKKFKRQCLQKSAQYKEQYAEKRKMSDRVRHIEDELKTLKSVRDELERDREAVTLRLKESRLSFFRIEREQDVLESQYKTMTLEKSKVDTQLLACRSYYEKELEKVRAKSMSEVQQILEDHPKVVEENRLLKQRLQKLNRGHSFGSSSSGFSRSTSKDINKALRQMDQQIRNRPNTMPSSSSTTTPTARRRDNGVLGRPSDNKYHHAGKQSTSAVKIIPGQYSSLASRMMKAKVASSTTSQKGKKPPQSAAVRDILAGPPSQNKDNKKRSSLTSSSILQNKRMKSFSASRRDIFQRKP
mmetsp:Transcript_15063/g.30794  ORF Transcript_15063/g.30794 Transcript_15063/m.30794 type:complete len:496 (+) Transcript_15063:454-1941(+)